MADFSIKHVLKTQLNDDGISVQELLKLLNRDDELIKALLKTLKIDKLEKDFINIAGAGTLVEIQNGINERFHKEDLISSLKDITVRNDEDFILQFDNLSENEYFTKLGMTSIEAKPKYSSKSDFFSWLYGMDKYASELMKNELSDILLYNLELLKQKEKGQENRKYRILHDLHNDDLFVRAIISLSRYNNYDNNVTIVIALLTLHSRMKELGVTYSLNRIEYNESYIRIFVEENNKRELKQVGYIKNIIEVSNDEVKREALRFDAISNIEFVDSEKKLQEIIIQPLGTRPKIKSNILAIAHSTTPQTFVEKLVEIENSVKIHDELFNLISEIAKITNPLQIIHLVRRKVDGARNEGFKKYKHNVQKMLDNHTVTNMIQLLSLFKKMDLLTEKDIEASEYIRFIIYESLIERK